MRRFLVLVAFLSTALPVTAAETVDAVWTEQKVDFRYISVEMSYSCDAMRAKIETLLLHLGADNVEVTAPRCAGSTPPRRDHRIVASFSTLALAGEGDADIVKAVWTEVELGKRHPRTIDDRDCELLQQFQEYVLVTIQHEVVAGSTGCGASRRSIAGRLKLKVLRPVPKDDDAKKADQE